jgi:hypothetical protein
MSLFDEPSRQPLPQPIFEDVKHSVGKGLASMIPLVGGAGSELIGLLSSPVAQRRDDWFEDLARRLHDLEGRVAGFKFDDLANNEQFVSATLQATQAALLTRDQEKLEALRNAVLNVALSNNLDEDQQAIFLSLVDSLTPAHLRMLKFFDAPKEEMARPIPAAIERAKKYVSGLQSLGDSATQLLFDDLHRDGFLSVTSDNQRIAPLNKRWTSNWGHEFITFITAPKETDNAK